jgi:hypothetical protein
MAEERTPLENAVAKVILLAQVQGITLDDLIAMLESGASMADILVALSPHEQQSRDRSSPKSGLRGG